MECQCSFVQCIADMKRSVDRVGWAPHPQLTSDDLLDWKMLSMPQGLLGMRRNSLRIPENNYLRR